MHLILLLFLNLAHANFGASQDEMDLFDLGNDFLPIRPSPVFGHYSTVYFGPKFWTAHFGPKIRSVFKIWTDKNHFTVEEVNANFYDYLGVPPDAEKKAINKQYRTLAKVIFIYSVVRFSDGHRLYTASRGIRTKWPSVRRTPLYLMLTNSNIFDLEFRRGIPIEIILKMLLKTFEFWQLWPKYWKMKKWGNDMIGFLLKERCHLDNFYFRWLKL